MDGWGMFVDGCTDGLVWMVCRWGVLVDGQGWIVDGMQWWVDGVGLQFCGSMGGWGWHEDGAWQMMKNGVEVVIRFNWLECSVALVWGPILVEWVIGKCSVGVDRMDAMGQIRGEIVTWIRMVLDD